MLLDTIILRMKSRLRILIKSERFGLLTSRLESVVVEQNYSEKIVYQALSFNAPDRLPVFENFWQAWENMWRKESGFASYIAPDDYFGMDIKIAAANETLFSTHIRTIAVEGESILQDDGWGRIVRIKPDTYFCEPVEHLFTNHSDIDNIEFDNALLDSRYEVFLETVTKYRQKGRAIFLKIGGVFIRSSFFRGEAEFLMDLASDESFAKSIAEKIGNHLLQIGIESLKRASQQNLGVWIYDDMCNVQGPMFSPQVFERVFLPIYKKMVSELKLAGAKWVILHCDGNLRPLLEMIIEAGFDGINPVERAAGLIIEDLIETYYGRLCFIGGICNTHILPNGDFAAIRSHIERVIQAGKNGGLIIGTHSIGPDIPVKHYELYRKILADKGKFI